jgi:hypothetical protein
MDATAGCNIDFGTFDQRMVADLINPSGKEMDESEATELSELSISDIKNEISSRTLAHIAC